MRCARWQGASARALRLLHRGERTTDIIPVGVASDEWDSLVWSSPYGTIFHTLKFLSYHPPDRFEFCHIAARDDKGLVAVLPGGKEVQAGKVVFRSPLGASFGGFVFAKPDLRKMLDLSEAMHARLAESGFDAVEMVLPPSCYYSHGDENLRYLMTASGYRLHSRDATSVVPLDAFDGGAPHDVLARNLRKAEKSGLEVKPAHGDEIDGFYRILVKNLAAKGLGPTHTLDELRYLVAAFPERVVVFEARTGGEVVGGCLVMVCSERAGLAFYICDDPDRRPLPVAEGALYRAVQWLKEKDVDFFDLGTVSKGTDINWGLVQFKSKFGSRTYVREHYRLDLKETPE
jgi:hypothetical protein